MFDDNNALIASWSYNIFFEWETVFSSGNPINEGYRPVNLNAQPIITILFIIMLLTAVFVVLFKDFGSTTSIASLRKYSYILLFLLILTAFYIVVFPIIYLLPNELYFPRLTRLDSDSGFIFSYSISFGYIFQLCGFILIFSYSLHYYITVVELEKFDYKSQIQIEKIIKHVQQPLDLDKYIAEEEIRRK